MNSIPLHPLIKPHLDKLAGLSEPEGAAGPEEIERRAQEILNEWQKFYFSGSSFTTPSGNDMINRTFQQCEILWGQATATSPSALPVLHTILADRRDGDPVRMGPSLYRVEGDWTWNTFIRTHPQNPGGAEALPVSDAAGLEADRVCRRVADQYAWLLRGPHIQELAFKGISHLRVTNGPRSVQSASWCLRQIVYTAKVAYHIQGNDP